eukprot:m.110200 g.110200  ORF g.110200 m.110200 type:complete len:669 (-) comp22708_c0_seq2:105-2111(-)
MRCPFTEEPLSSPSPHQPLGDDTPLAYYERGMLADVKTPFVVTQTKLMNGWYVNTLITASDFNSNNNNFNHPTNTMTNNNNHATMNITQNSHNEELAATTKSLLSPMASNSNARASTCLTSALRGSAQMLSSPVQLFLDACSRSDDLFRLTVPATTSTSSPNSIGNPTSALEENTTPSFIGFVSIVDTVERKKSPLLGSFRVASSNSLLVAPDPSLKPNTAAVVAAATVTSDQQSSKKSAVFLPILKANLSSKSVTTLPLCEWWDSHSRSIVDLCNTVLNFKKGQPQSSSDNKQGNQKKPPLLMLHGMGGGIGLWSKNIDGLAEHFQIFAIDTIGFGRSSRIHFGDGPDIERCLVDAIELWRKAHDIEHFYLLGHSFGGFQASLYALEHPKRVKRLFLVDPWGFEGKPKPSERVDSWRPRPLWYRFLRSVSFSIAPFMFLRLLGPLGPYFLERTRPDFVGKFGNDVPIFDYVSQLNALPPSGEIAFADLATDSGRFALQPLMDRIQDIDPEVPITFIFGEQSWMNPEIGHTAALRRHPRAHTQVVIVPGGHHLYADSPADFNELIGRLHHESHHLSADNAPNTEALEIGHQMTELKQQQRQQQQHHQEDNSNTDNNVSSDDNNNIDSNTQRKTRPTLPTLLQLPDFHFYKPLQKPQLVWVDTTEKFSS